MTTAAVVVAAVCAAAVFVLGAVLTRLRGDADRLLSPDRDALDALGEVLTTAEGER